MAFKRATFYIRKTVQCFAESALSIRRNIPPFRLLNIFVQLDSYIEFKSSIWHSQDLGVFFSFFGQVGYIVGISTIT